MLKNRASVMGDVDASQAAVGQDQASYLCRTPRADIYPSLPSSLVSHPGLGSSEVSLAPWTDLLTSFISLPGKLVSTSVFAVLRV